MSSGNETIEYPYATVETSKERIRTAPSSKWERHTKRRDAASAKGGAKNVSEDEMELPILVSVLAYGGLGQLQMNPHGGFFSL